MGTESHWRRKAKTVITKVISEVGGEDLKKLKRAISAAYPFGPRKMHPYKIWLDEVKFQLAQFSPNRRELGRKKRKKRKRRGNAVEQIPSNEPLPGQMTLFD
jgi:hypothetical protein